MPPSAVKANGHFLVDAELCSTDAGGRRVLHARATIVLASKLLRSPKPAPAQVLPRYRRSLESVYDELLFHGPELQGLISVDGCDETGIVAACKPAPVPRQWSDHPLRSRWIADPLAIDCSFQLMILWSQERHNVGCLPTRVRSYRQYRANFPTEGVRIEVRITGDDHGKAVADIDWLDSAGQLVARTSGYQCVVDASLNDAFRRNTLDARSAAGR